MSGGGNKVLDLIKEHGAEFVDFRFTDPKGKWQHTAYAAAQVNDEVFTDGVMFDGSSIAGWQSIDQSDMILLPLLPEPLIRLLSLL